jgi:hypothetical protein
MLPSAVMRLGTGAIAAFADQRGGLEEPSIEALNKLIGLLKVAIIEGKTPAILAEDRS